MENRIDKIRASGSAGSKDDSVAEPGTQLFGPFAMLG